jgi:hypothetical protein
VGGEDEHFTLGREETREGGDVVAAWRMITTWPPPLMRVQIASSAAIDAGAERRASART